MTETHLLILKKQLELLFPTKEVFLLIVLFGLRNFLGGIMKGIDVFKLSSLVMTFFFVCMLPVATIPVVAQHDMSKMPGMNKPKAKSKSQGTSRKKKRTTRKKQTAKKHDMSNMPGMNMPGMKMSGMHRRKTSGDYFSVAGCTICSFTSNEHEYAWNAEATSIIFRVAANTKEHAWDANAIGFSASFASTKNGYAHADALRQSYGESLVKSDGRNARHGYGRNEYEHGTVDGYERQ